MSKKRQTGNRYQMIRLMHIGLVEEKKECHTKRHSSSIFLKHNASKPHFSLSLVGPMI
jgi:hypothetical protein